MIRIPAESLGAAGVFPPFSCAGAKIRTVFFHLLDGKDEKGFARRTAHFHRKAGGPSGPPVSLS